MNGWALKETAYEAVKSHAVKGWMKSFNMWVPCRVMWESVILGECDVKFNPGSPGLSVCTVRLPIQAIHVDDPKVFKHSVPLIAFEAYLIGMTRANFRGEIPVSTQVQEKH